MAGLDRVQKLEPGRGYVEVMGGVSSLSGPFIRGEVGRKLTPSIAANAFIQAAPRETMGGVGLQWRF